MKKSSTGKAEKPARKKVEQLNKILVENFVSLQKVMTEVAGKFDRLSDNIAKLLNLFEISARTFMEKQAPADLEKDKEFLDKLNALLEQNKTIAKGLTLMEEKVRERVYGPVYSGEETPKAPIPSRLMPARTETTEEMPERFKKLPRF